MGDAPRRINTVTPIMSDQRMLAHLMQEMNAESQANEENEMKLKMMLDKYQQEVRAHHQTDLPAWQSMTTSVRTDNQLCAPPINNPLQSASSHSQPCLASSNDPASSGSSWTCPPSVEKRRLAYTRGRSTEQSCLSGGIPSQYEGSAMLPTHAPPPPPPPLPSSSQQQQAYGYMPSSSGSNGLQQAVQAMRQENVFLRQEVDRLTQKANNLQRLESEHAQIEKDYEMLLREKEGIEEMERAAFSALESRLKSSEQDRDSLRDQLAQATASHHLITEAVAKIEECSKLSAFVAVLSRQKDDLVMVVERQRRELDTQTMTLEEQRKHIAVLESALQKAQERVQMSDKIIDEMRAERMADKKDGATSNGGVHRSSSKNSSPSTTTSSNGADENSVLRWHLKSRDETIAKLESTLAEFQKRAEESDRMKNAMALTFNEKIEGLQREKYDRDRRIAELTEYKERLIAGLPIDSPENGGEGEEEMKRTRDMNKMEEVRQRIQEKKKCRPLPKNPRSLTSWSSTSQLVPSTSSTVSHDSGHNRAPPSMGESMMMMGPPPSIQYPPQLHHAPSPSQLHHAPPPQPQQNNYTSMDYLNSRTTVREADL